MTEGPRERTGESQGHQSPFRDLPRNRMRQLEPLSPLRSAWSERGNMFWNAVSRPIDTWNKRHESMNEATAKRWQLRHESLQHQLDGTDYTVGERLGLGSATAVYGTAIYELQAQLGVNLDYRVVGGILAIPAAGGIYIATKEMIDGWRNRLRKNPTLSKHAKMTAAQFAVLTGAEATLGVIGLPPSKELVGGTLVALGTGKIVKGVHQGLVKFEERRHKKKLILDEKRKKDQTRRGF